MSALHASSVIPVSLEVAGHLRSSFPFQLPQELSPKVPERDIREVVARVFLSKYRDRLPEKANAVFGESPTRAPLAVAMRLAQYERSSSWVLGFQLSPWYCTRLYAIGEDDCSWKTEWSALRHAAVEARPVRFVAFRLSENHGRSLVLARSDLSSAIDAVGDSAALIIITGLTGRDVWLR